MTKLVKQISDLVQLATDKGITAYWSYDQIMDVIDQGQMQLFRQCLAKHPRDKRVRNMLLPFEKRAPVGISVSGNVGALPSDFEHEIEAYVTVDSIDYQVHFEEAGFFRQRITDPIDVPSTTNVIACVHFNVNKRMEVSPFITPVQLSYFKRPVKPVFATTEVNGQLIYDDTNSTDVEWSGLYHDILVENALAILGVGSRDMALMRAGQKAEPKEAHL